MAKMLKYTVIRPCFIAGTKKKTGDVVELDESEGNHLVAIERLISGDQKLAPSGKGPKEKGDKTPP